MEEGADAEMQISNMLSCDSQGCTGFRDDSDTRIDIVALQSAHDAQRSTGNKEGGRRSELLEVNNDAMLDSI